jgi:hypothetical protein
MKTYQKMDMILHTVYSIWMTLFIFADSPDIAEQVFPFFGQEARNPVFCGKDDMYIIWVEVDKRTAFCSTPSGLDLI